MYNMCLERGSWADGGCVYYIRADHEYLRTAKVDACAHCKRLIFVLTRGGSLSPVTVNRSRSPTPWPKLQISATSVWKS